MSLEVLEATRRDYAARMNRVIDHLEAHLGDALDLAALARVACFSPFHFHRLFKAWTGESPAAYLQRLRLERAANQLEHNPRKPITEIALDCGFGSASAFARAFRAHHGRTAGQWRAGVRKPGQASRKPGQAGAGPGLGTLGASGQAHALEASMTPFPLAVRIEDLPDLCLAYLRHAGPVQAGPDFFPRLVGRLRTWAGARGLLRPESLTLLVYPDNPEATPEARRRLDVALSVPAGTRGEGEVGVRTLPAGRWALARVELRPDQYEAAWDVFLRDWLPGSGWQLDDRPALQISRRPPGALHLVDLGLPVRPL